MRFIRVHETDNVAVALQDTPPDFPITLVGGALPDDLRTRDAIPANHKVALAAIAADAPIHKHGVVIGYATQDIAPGEHVHTHNTIGVQDYQIQQGGRTT
jgi:altronate hydrolase